MYHEYLPIYSEYVFYHYPQTQSFQKEPSFLLRCSSPAVSFSGQHLHLCRLLRPAEIWKSSPVLPLVCACGFKSPECSLSSLFHFSIHSLIISYLAIQCLNLLLCHDSHSPQMAPLSCHQNNFSKKLITWLFAF